MSIKFKRHYKLILSFITLILILLIGFPETRMTAITTQLETVEEIEIQNYDNNIDLFDDTVMHEIVVLISEDDQARMVNTFVHTAAKDYFPADVIIDGVHINNVGLRLKGNATLAMSTGMGMLSLMDLSDLPEPPPDMDVPSFNLLDAILSGEFGPPEGFGPPEEMPPGMELPEGVDFMTMMFGGEGIGEIPYLIKFDEFVPGQRYQGYAEIALRTGGVLPDAALLSEPISNYVMDTVGVPMSKSVYGNLQMTGSEPKLYVVAEHMDEIYIDELFPGSNGVLYKIDEEGSDFKYIGEDPTLYSTMFSQETAQGDADLAPLIDLMRFVTEASEQEFATQLADHFDIVAFADYLAVTNLIGNFDSLAGIGNNYYLYYDIDSQITTILGWDTNEGLGKMPVGSGPEMDPYWAETPFGLDFMAPPSDEEEQDGHLLKMRFMETPAFLTLYEERYRHLYKQIYTEDIIIPQINVLTSLFTAYNAEHNLVAQEEYDSSVDRILDYVAKRGAYLETTELLSAQ